MVSKTCESVGEMAMVIKNQPRPGDSRVNQITKQNYFKVYISSDGKESYKGILEKGK